MEQKKYKSWALWLAASALAVFLREGVFRGRHQRDGGRAAERPAARTGGIRHCEQSEQQGKFIRRKERG